MAIRMHIKMMSTHTLRAERILCTRPFSFRLLVFREEVFLSTPFSMSSIMGFCLRGFGAQSSGFRANKERVRVQGSNLPCC